MRNLKFQITNLELAIIRCFRQWFNISHLNKEAVLQIVELILKNNPSFGQIKDPDRFVQLLFSVKLKSYYRRLQSDEVKQIIEIIQENKSFSLANSSTKYSK